jgi:hypothetical protein
MLHGLWKHPSGFRSVWAHQQPIAQIPFRSLSRRGRRCGTATDSFVPAICSLPLARRIE